MVPKAAAETMPAVMIVGYLEPWVNSVLVGLDQHYSMDSAESDLHVSRLVKNDERYRRLLQMIRGDLHHLDLHGMALLMADGKQAIENLNPAVETAVMTQTMHCRLSCCRNSYGGKGQDLKLADSLIGEPSLMTGCFRSLG